MRKNTFRLGVKPSSFYLERFNAADLGVAGEEPTAFTRVGEGDLEFEVHLPVEFGAVRSDLVPLARSVLAQIVDMDDAARERASDGEDELLAAIAVREFFVEFRYWSTIQNADWSAYFTLGEHGEWRHRGTHLPWMTRAHEQKPAPIMALDAAYTDTAAGVAGVYFADWSAASPDGAFSRRIEVEPHQYEPGDFYKRELPALMQLLDASPVAVSTLIVDAYVWLSGDGRPGLGARLYEALARRVPVIGVAKTRFHNDTWSQPVRRGASDAPLYVTGAGLDRTDAANRVAKMSGAGRIPASLKQADALARSALSA